MHLTPREIRNFQATLMTYYDQRGRHDLPWRRAESDRFDPYKIAVSELMLQQTQVQRVIPKYQAFLEQFPTVTKLATASLGEVLVAWQGLGYNRRAKFLWQTAQAVQQQHGGTFPDSLDGLVALPGIGKNTAGAILAYAFNKPEIFIETNVRTVYIHHFFKDGSQVDDKEIRSLVEQTILADSPREFYWALMDYGTFLKKNHGNAAARSKHFVKQSAFEGSRRQVRGRVLRALGAGGHGLEVLAESIADERLVSVLDDLQREGLIERRDDVYHLS